MTKPLIALLTFSCLFIGIGCHSNQPTGETTKAEDLTSVIDATKGDVVTGDALMDDYVKLLCSKYSECGITAFSNETDCSNRLKAVLSQDPNWAQLKLQKEGLKTCLADFKSLACDDFKSGKTPESCTKL